MVRAEPSPLFLGHVEALRQAAQLGPVVDLACGRGRHAARCGALGLPTLALDRNAEFLAELQDEAARDGLPVWCVRGDLETQHGIPLAPGSCGAVLVFRFLYRPLSPAIEAILAPGGLLLYETFHRGQLALDWGPRREAFVLEPGELPTLFPGLEIEVADEGLWQTAGRSEASARLVARKPR